jgi:hypothetical protein
MYSKQYVNKNIMQRGVFLDLSFHFSLIHASIVKLYRKTIALMSVF